MAQVLADDIGSCFKLIFVLTSAIYAISHYYDSRQKTSMKDEKKKLTSLDLTSNENNRGIQKVKTDIAGLVNEEPKNNQTIIIGLWLMFVIYTIFLCVILTPFALFAGDYSIAIWLISIVLVLVSFRLTYNLYVMKTQMDKFKNEVESTLTAYETVKIAIEDNETPPSASSVTPE